MKQPSADLIAPIAGFTILVIILVLGFLTLHILLVPLVTAAFVAYLFEPAVVALQRRGMQRGAAFVLLLVLSGLAVVTLLYLAPAWLRLESLNTNTGNFSERLQKQLGRLEQSISHQFPLFQSVHIASKINERATEVAARVFEGLPALISAVTLNLLLVPFIAYFMVRDGRTLRRRLVSLVPNRYFEMSLMMLHRIDQQIGGYLRGRIIECMLVAVTQLTMMGIALLFVPQPQIPLIAIVCGATNLIPYVGPLMGAGFGVLLYLGALGLPIGAVYGLILATLATHVIDNIAIAPLVLAQNVDLHPLTVALVLVIGGELLGILGLLIAIPVAASMKVIASEIWANYQVQSRLTG